MGVGAARVLRQREQLQDAAIWLLLLFIMKKACIYNSYVGLNALYAPGAENVRTCHTIFTNPSRIALDHTPQAWYNIRMMM